MDPSSRRPQLPALNYLDVDKIKREEEAYQVRHVGTSSQSLSNSTAASPTYHYPSAPPPPYSHAHTSQPHANTWPALSPAIHTPPESRRTSEHEQESAKQPPRQSLPSISEALGVDSQTAFTVAPAPAQPHLPQSHPAAPAPPSPTSRRAYPMEPAGPPSSFPAPGTHSTVLARGDAVTHSSYPKVLEISRAPASYPAVVDSKPSLHLQTAETPARPPPPTSFSRPAEPSPTYEQPPAHASGAMGPPNSFSYGYQAFPPRYANPTPPSSVSSGPIYQPSTAYGAAQPTSAWNSENGQRHEEQHAGQGPYADNVKRHLEFYDLEAALNDIASTSGILTDFSRRYGDRMHQTQRTGPSLSQLPSIVEVDDMISKSRVQLDSLSRIRDVILAQQALYEQQVADQRHKTFNEPSQPVLEQQLTDNEDKPNVGFATVDTKKRRGRAAPPGRCHSCNRAETPEWRRGPDGARTLCNACGLHYAKLTRKKNGANNNTANVGSSNLRPKESISQ